jgi:stage II sporulation protein P
VRAVFALVCAAAIVAAVIFLSVRIAALFDGREGGNGGSYPIGDGQSQSEQTENESTESTESSLNGGYVTESFAEDNTESEQISDGETSSDSELPTDDTSAETLNDTVTLDISDASGSLGHVINFSDKDIDEDGLLDGGFMYTETRGDPAPVVMIIHTHTSEEYTKNDSSSFKGLNSVVSVGESINAKLNAAGLSAVHCTVIHDADDVNAYVSARETIKTMLQIYPSIKYVIDVHRMDREEDGRIVKTLSEVGSAQMKITVSADGTTGRNWQDGLALAIALRQELNSDGKALCAPTVLSAGRYNSDLCRYYLMLDVGARGNTTEEAMAAGEYFAEALLSVVLTN